MHSEAQSIRKNLEETITEHCSALVEMQNIQDKLNKKDLAVPQASCQAEIGWKSTCQAMDNLHDKEGTGQQEISKLPEDKAAHIEQERQACRERSPRLKREQPDPTKEEIVAPLFQNGATKGPQEAL